MSSELVATKDTVLSKLVAARMLLEEVQNAQDAKKVADLAYAAMMYAKRQRCSEEVIQFATSIRVDSLACLGEQLKAMEKNAGGRPVKTSSRRAEVSQPTLPDLGISHKESSTAQTLAAVKRKTPELFAEARTGKKSVSRVIAETRRTAERPPPNLIPAVEFEAIRTLLAQRRETWPPEMRPIFIEFVGRILEYMRVMGQESEQ